MVLLKNISHFVLTFSLVGGHVEIMSAHDDHVIRMIGKKQEKNMKIRKCNEKYLQFRRIFIRRKIPQKLV